MEHSNKYIFIYSVVMVVVIAISLTIVAVQLKPAQEDNTSGLKKCKIFFHP